MSVAFFMPSNNLFGAGALADAIKQMAGLGFKKALIVTDKPLVDLGFAADIQKQLAAVGVDSFGRSAMAASSVASSPSSPMPVSLIFSLQISRCFSSCSSF